MFTKTEKNNGGCRGDVDSYKGLQGADSCKGVAFFFNSKSYGK